MKATLISRLPGGPDRSPAAAIAVGMVFIGALARLLPHIPNVSPVAALALFGGARLGARHALAVPLVAMMLADAGLHWTKGYPLATGVTPFVYGAFAAVGLAGMALRRAGLAGRALPIAGVSLAGSALFFLVTNFAVWLVSDRYAKTSAGLIACYGAGLPFFRNSAVGNLCWTAGLFGVHAWAVRGALRFQRAEASG